MSVAAWLAPDLDDAAHDLRIADVLTFVTVRRCGSISAAARELMVTPSQVSKSISRLEELLGAAVMARGPQGVELLAEGRRVLPRLEQMLALTRELQRQASAAGRVLTIAAPPEVARFVIPHLAALAPAVRTRTLEVPLAQLRARLAAGQIDLALSLVELPSRPSWRSRLVGHVEHALFAAPDTAARLGPPPIPRRRLAEVPVIGALERIEAVGSGDDAPGAGHERPADHETTTLGLALAMVARSHHVVAAPVFVALPLLRAGALVRLEVAGGDPRDPLYLAHDAVRVGAAEHEVVLAAIDRALADVDRDAAPAPRRP